MTPKGKRGGKTPLNRRRSLWSSEYDMKAKLSYLKRRSLLILWDYLFFIV